MAARHHGVALRRVRIRLERLYCCDAEICLAGNLRLESTLQPRVVADVNEMNPTPRYLSFVPAVVAVILAALAIGVEIPEGHSRYSRDMRSALGYLHYDEFPLQAGWNIYLPRDEAEQLGLHRAFWRTVHYEEHPESQVRLKGGTNDAGRAWLLGRLFQVRGGPMPYLLFWIALLVAVPLLGWLNWELYTAGHAVAAAVLLPLLALSSYVTTTLSTSYSATGFYLIGILLLITVAVFCVLRRRLTINSWSLRVIAAGGFFALCMMCRNGTLALMPGFVLAFWWATADEQLLASVRSIRWFRQCNRYGLLLLTLLLFAFPTILFRGYMKSVMHSAAAQFDLPTSPTMGHPVWHNVWCGLGDFDDTGVHVWDDLNAATAVVEAGGPDLRSIIRTSASKEYEVFIRKMFLDKITDRPAWFAEILLKRVAATVFQTKTLPHTMIGGRATLVAKDDGGAIDSYYRLTAHGDVFEIGGRRIELSLLPFIFATIALLVAGIRQRCAAVDAEAALFPQSCIVGCIAIGTIGVPVLITTAAGIETQAFCLVYFVAAAFGLEWCIWRYRASRAVTDRPAQDVDPPNEEPVSIM